MVKEIAGSGQEIHKGGRGYTLQTVTARIAFEYNP